MTQYSQHGEDTFIMQKISDGLVIPRTVLDIGAADGKFFSNSRMFLEDGWSGILIEPNKEAFDELVKNSEHFDAKCYNYAIAEKNKVAKLGGGGHYTTNYINDSIGLEVNCVTLDEIKLPDKIGIASIDVEGMDFVVLQQLLRITRPAIIIIEANDEDSMKLQNDYLFSDDYELLKIMSVNTIWIDSLINS